MPIDRPLANDEVLPAGRRWLIVLFSASTFFLVVTLGIGSITLLKSSAFINRSSNTRILVERNARVLPQTSRELQRVIIDIRSKPIDLELLNRHRAFVAQRVQEAKTERAQRALFTEDMVQTVRDLADAWEQDLEPRIAQVVAGRALTKVGEDELIADLTDLELEYNAIANSTEVAKRDIGAKLLDEDTAAAKESRELMVLLGGLVGTSSLFAAASSVALWRLGRRLAASANRLRDVNRDLQTVSQVAERTQNFVLILDPTGHIEWSNDALASRTGFAPETIIGKQFWWLVSEAEDDDNSDDHNADDMDVARRIERHQEFTCELLIRCNDGPPFLASVEHRAVADRGEVVHTIVIGSDISEQRETEQFLIKAKDAAEAAAKAKSSFLATMSHEIRTPLNAVIGTSELLMGTELSDEQLEYAEVARSSGRLLLSIVNDILTFSALEAERTELVAEPFDSKLLLNNAVQMLAPTANAKGLELGWSFTSDGSAWLLGDANRTSQIVVNVLSNAVKFTDVGSVQMSAKVVQGTLSIDVTDTGIGIPEDRMGELFKPFSQVDTSTTRRHGGTGLGLAICRQLASAMGGSIEIASRAGEGTTVSVVLPLTPIGPDEAHAQWSSTDVGAPGVSVHGIPAAVHSVANDGGHAGARGIATNRSGETSGSFSDLRVLVAEDDPVNRTVAVRLLERLGVVAETVSDGAAAVAAVADAAAVQPFDVVLMDVHMPVLDGMDAARQINALALGEARPRIVALTANALPGDRERFVNEGMDDYLAKPVSLSDLSDALERTLAAQR